MKKVPFRKFLQNRQNAHLPVFFDGGMGTMIHASGAKDYSIPEELNITQPDIITSIYRQYLEAGANVITANSFGANPVKLGSESAYSCEELVTSAVTLIKDAIAAYEESLPAGAAPQNRHAAYAAWDTGQIGRLLEPMGTLTFDEAYESYKTACTAAEKAGAELAVIETMSDLYEMKAAILAVKENTSLPIVASATFQNNLRTLTGADVHTCVTYLEALGVDVLGFNCGGSLKEDAELARQFCMYSHIPVLAQPNAGLPAVVKGRTVFLVEPEEFSQAQLVNRASGVSVLGGCCGTTPAHIRAMIAAISAQPADNAGDAAPSAPADTSCICSYNRTVQIGGSAGPQIIGERINPTGKKKCKEALLAGNMNFVLGEAEAQINAGAQILDVNVGLPGIDEADTMRRAVSTIQAAFSTPLQIDSSEPDVLEKALRYYNGKALVNSVNGKAESMARVFPLIRRYGGSVVALCIDENGISPTAEGRCAVARRIISEAAKYGIAPRDIFIDTLTLTVSSQQKEALETLRAVSMLKKKYGAQGLKFVLGVSNISFGLPRRDIINSRFLAMALYSGLDACIINPLSEPMMDSYRAYRALAGFDENCLSYIDTYKDSVAPGAGIPAAVPTAGTHPAQSAASAAGSAEPGTTAGGQSAGTNSAVSANPAAAQLIDIICKGFRSQAAAVTEKLLETTEPVDIISGCIVPALDRVGKDFETGRKFLPQLLLSAETVGSSFEVIKRQLAASGRRQESAGTIVIATVYGDIHDIGKNIVKAMLENYGYTVVDLGKNVAPETIVQTVLEQRIRLVGLSALMTTTVINMEKTIRLLKEAMQGKDWQCRIMAGGAVLTADYAAKIGADYYAKDAMTSVAIAKEVFSK